MELKSREKLIDEIGKMSVLELADLVKALEVAFNVSAAMPTAAAAPVAGDTQAAAAAEKTEYKVTLTAVDEKIKAIKALRKVVPTLSLSDAKKAVEEVPTVIAEAASKADAQAMKKELEEAGAKVELA